MFPGSGQFDDPLTAPAAFISPRDREVTTFSCWERGGDGLGEPGNGVNTTNWQYVCDPETGEVVVTPEGGAAVSVYTIDPLPLEFTGSFDFNMEPVIAWRDVNNDCFIRYFDGAEFVNLALPTVSSLRLAIDDVRDVPVAAGVCDTILAYVLDGVAIYRLSRDNYDTEYEDPNAEGFFTISQIGMNTEYRFQFERSRTQPESTPSLSYREIDQRASKMLGFDEDGAAAFYDIVTDGEVGVVGPTSSVTKLDVSDTPQFFFLRARNGVGFSHSDVTVRVSFYLDGGRRRAVRFLTYGIDADGNITRTDSFSQGEAPTSLVEVGAGTPVYTCTIYLPESGRGATFSVVMVGSVPTMGTFIPIWNDNNDFTGGGFTPAGAVRYADYGSYVALALAAATGYDGRSTSTRLRWGAGSLPESLRPTTARVVPCSVRRNGVTLAGQAQFNADGSAEFWPLTVSSTRLIRGTFLASTTVDITKGLPAGWQLVYGK